MQVDYLENERFPIGLLEQGSLSGVAALVKELLTRTPVHEEKQDRLSYWQLFFLQSKGTVAFTVGRIKLGVAQEHLVSGTTEPSEGSRILSTTGQELNMPAVSVSSGRRTNPCYGAER